jgi:hypothetical protein
MNKVEKKPETRDEQNSGFKHMLFLCIYCLAYSSFLNILRNVGGLIPNYTTLDPKDRTVLDTAVRRNHVLC